MSEGPSEMEIVGMRVRCTLVAPDGNPQPNPGAVVVPRTVEGTVYTFNPDRGYLVLMTEVGSERSSFRTLNLSFIEDIALVPHPDGKTKAGTPTPEQALPPGVAQYATLPSLQSDSTETLERRINQKKKLGEENRKYNGMEDEISIRALEVLDQLSRVYPDAKWDEDKNCITVGKDISVKGIPSWNKPKVKGPPEQKEAVERIQRQLDTRR